MKMDLDDAFAVSAHIAGAERLPAVWAKSARAFRDVTRHLADVPYGEGTRDVFDLFLPERLAKGTVVFIHGGYWRMSDKSDWSDLAAGALAAGWAVAMPSYDLCPKVGIAEITRQVARAVAAIAERTPGPLRITGHSAGGHLAARMLDPAVAGPWLERVEKVVAISPLTDLEPLLRTTMNADFGLDLATARAESPVHQVAPQVPVVIWVGGDERPVFLQQARALSHAWGCACEVDPGRHHFDVLDGLRDMRHPLMQALLAED